LGGNGVTNRSGSSDSNFSLSAIGLSGPSMARTLRPHCWHVPTCPRILSRITNNLPQGQFSHIGMILTSNIQIFDLPEDLGVGSGSREEGVSLS
jgi:hypothetical protein